MNNCAKALLGSAVLAFVAFPSSAATLDDVREAGSLRCGVHTGLPGFGYQNEDGQWRGFDVDYCRAVAAAVLQDPAKVEYTPLSPVERFPALQKGEIDLLARNTTWTMRHDTTFGLDFAGINYYDGQGFMVHRDLDVTSALQLSGATICVQSGTTTELNLSDYFRANNMRFNPVIVEAQSDVNAAYEQGRCDVLTTDASGLYATRLELADPDAHVVLPEIISKEPLGPVVRNGDPQWLDIVRWVHFGLLNAEELGVTQDNVDEMLNSDDPGIRRLLGVDGSFGEDLGLSNDWMVHVIRAVGNYGEIFARNVGPDTPLKIQRGQNELWTRGGLQYAPPIR